MFPELKEKGKSARQAARRLAALDTSTKNNALKAIAHTIMEREPEILTANDHDIDAGQEAGLNEALLDRLLLTVHRLESIAKDVLAVEALPDPIGETFETRILPNGLRIGKQRVPVGVLGVIYESRPNVTVDISALCLKSGNVAILRGGKEALNTNRALAEAIAEACNKVGVPQGAVQLIQSQDRAMVKEMLTANQYIDMIIPRGGAGLHKFALENATIPVITGGIGICHIYVDQSADPEKVVPIVHNAKVQRPTVCNALDTLLIHKDVARAFLPEIADDLARAGVELRCEPRALTVLMGHPAVRSASPGDFDTEFLSLVLAVKVVDGLDEALDHIYQHGTHHSDAILTENYSHAMRFVNEVDSAAVYVNASTRFTDGGQFGLGAEVAVSTQRLHARGPMGLKELTTYKWVVFGEGQVRG
ncbi:MAG: glutamate-5-semialdehyde dehydrogenase [Anaerolineales bacterium]|nr:MAG: glutamate-5-semialdehyde dehydrogenase [Anaerolineales bacterium]